MRWLLQWWRWLTDRHHNPHPLSDHDRYPKGDPPSGMDWPDDE